jgi:hypothetical protein
MWRNKLRVTIAAATLVAAAVPATAALTRQDRKAAEKMLAGDLYLRIDAPCTQGRQPFGIYLAPLVEISPKGANTDADENVSFGWYHASSTVWNARVNDLMHFDELEWDDENPGAVEIELEGAGASEGRDTVVRFVEINSLADFEAAFGHTFSKKPLQEEHPDWPAEIRKAIAERKLSNGMNKRQVYYVVGTPAEIEKRTEKGKEIEIWTLRQKGVEIGFWYASGGESGPPETLRFENGVLVAAEGSRSGKDLDLDN